MNNTEIKTLFSSLVDKQPYLNEVQLRFIQSAHRYWKKTKQLTVRQISILRELEKYVIPETSDIHTKNNTVQQ